MDQSLLAVFSALWLGILRIPMKPITWSEGRRSLVPIEGDHLESERSDGS